MSDHAPAAAPEPSAYDEMAIDDEPRTGSRVGMVMAALIAVAASGSLAWWFGAPDRSADVGAPPAAPVATAPPKAEAPTPLRFAAADPDAGQVRQAWADVSQGYADAGPEGLVRASQACAKAVTTDPQRLDYCLAYDIYASAVAPPEAQANGQGDWFAGAGDRDLALARTALPEGVSPDNRLSQVAALTKAVLPKAAPARPRLQAVHAARKPPARPKVLKVRRLHRPAPGAKPKLIRAALKVPAVVRDPAVPSIDDFLNRPPPGEDPLDPPH